MPKLLTQVLLLRPQSGRVLIGMVAGFTSEQRPASSWNARPDNVGIRTWNMLLRDEPDPARRRMLTDLIIAEQNRLLQLVLSDQLNSAGDGLTGANDNR